MLDFKKAVVIGSGNWGNVIAKILSSRIPVTVWSKDRQEADLVNSKYSQLFPKEKCKHEVNVEPKFASNFSEKQTLIVMAVPSSQVLSVSQELARYVSNPVILSISKGFDINLLCTPSGMIHKIIPGAVVVCLTGPTIANEVSESLPTSAVLSSDNLVVLAQVRDLLNNGIIDFQISCNPVAHEICAALKGIIANGVGIADGLGLGVNFQSVVITKGISEMAKVASFFNVSEETVYGLSGIGDVMTTCMSYDSRNRKFGYLIGKGLSPEQALTEVKMTVEGVSMSKTIEALWSFNISIPIFHFVNNAVFNKVPNLKEGFLQAVRGTF